MLFQQKNIAQKLINRCSACVLLVNIEKKRMGEQIKSGDVKSALRWIENGCVYFKIEAARVCSGVNNIFGDEVAKVFSEVSWQ